jgi:hypothetical protein
MQHRGIVGRVRQALGWVADDPDAEHRGRVERDRAAVDDALAETDTANLPASGDEQPEP